MTTPNTPPRMIGNDVARMDADGAPDDMVLLGEDGSLTLAPHGDMAQYQQAGQWPRYVCRVATITAMIRRAAPDIVAEELNGLMAQQFTLDSLRGPHLETPPPPPGNAPVHIGDGVTTIRPDVW